MEGVSIHAATMLSGTPVHTRTFMCAHHTLNATLVNEINSVVLYMRALLLGSTLFHS